MYESDYPLQEESTLLPYEPLRTSGTTASDDLAKLIKQIGKIRPLLAANAQGGEAERRLSEDSIEALIDAGAFRVSVPRRYGGYELGHRAAIEVGREVALADGLAAWAVSLINSGAWYVRQFPVEAQDDVFGADPDARVSFIVAPTGTAVEVDGGYRVTGDWSYGAGSWHATWALAAVQIADGRGALGGEGQLLLPATALEVWDEGEAAESNLLIAHDVFVPEHRIIVGPSIGSDANPAYRAFSVPLALLGPQLGLGWAVFDAVMKKAPDKPIAYTSFAKHSDSVAFQLDVARAAMLLDTAELFAARAAGDMDSIAAYDRPLDHIMRSRVRADIGWAVEKVSEAISLLITAHGSAAFAESSPIQRFWRDQAMVARHGYMLPPVAYEIYGKALLGVDNVMGTLF